ncbi:MAG: response regulator [Pseudomonadota bacterium]
MRGLIIEDEDDIADCMEQSLSDLGIAADRFARGGPLTGALQSAEYDIVVLDLNLPDIDGLSALEDLRRRGCTTPVLIVSARIEIEDRVRGLDIGADDYLTKPFDLMEFEARVRALLRRDKDCRPPLLTHGDLSFDQAQRTFMLKGNMLELPPRESAVLETLIRQNGGVISKTKIAQHVFSYDDDAGTSSIELYVHRLRRKLADTNVRIITRRGVGYALARR